MCGIHKHKIKSSIIAYTDLVLVILKACSIGKDPIINYIRNGGFVFKKHQPTIFVTKCGKPKFIFKNIAVYRKIPWVGVVSCIGFVITFYCSNSSILDGFIYLLWLQLLPLQQRLNNLLPKGYLLYDLQQRCCENRHFE